MDRPQNAVIERSLRETMSSLASAAKPKPKALWQDFDKRSAAYYSALDAALGSTSDAPTAAGARGGAAAERRDRRARGRNWTPGC